MSRPIVFPCHYQDWVSVKYYLQQALDADTLDGAFDKLHTAYNIVIYGTTSCKTRKLKTPYKRLRYFMEVEGEETEAVFHKQILPTIISLVMRCESLMPDFPLSVVPAQSPETVCLSRHLVASIIACGFLCMFDGRGREKFFSFSELLEYQWDSNDAKLRMLLNYFRRLSVGGPPEGQIILRRLCGAGGKPSQEHLEQSTQELCALVVKATGKIEDAGGNVLQVDFANKCLGGGVLGDGNVQEEIRFCICPELIASMLVMEDMEANEAVIMEGCEQFSSYTGYGNKLRFDGDFNDNAPRGADGRILTTVTAIDAENYLDTPAEDQYKVEFILRDINKAYVGFYQPYLPCHDKPLETSDDPDWVFKLDPKKKRTIATGNWGCGVFGGDPQLKSMLQWIAASIAKCPAVVYYSFEDPNVEKLAEVGELVRRLRWNVGDLAKVVFAYCRELVKKQHHVELFEFLLDLEEYEDSEPSDSAVSEKKTEESPKKAKEESMEEN